MPNGRLLRFAGTDHYPMVGEAWSLLAAAREFLGDGLDSPHLEFDRMLTTVLFTEEGPPRRRVTVRWQPDESATSEEMGVFAGGSLIAGGIWLRTA